MSNHLSGVIMEGFVNCCHRSRGPAKGCSQKDEADRKGKVEEVRVICIEGKLIPEYAAPTPIVN